MLLTALKLILKSKPSKHSVFKSTGVTIKQFYRYLFNKSNCDRLIKLLSEENLKKTLEVSPLIPFKMTRPYFCKNLEASGRFEVLNNHYTFLKDNYSYLVPSLFSDEGLFLGKFQGENSYKFTLKNDNTMRREVELTLSISDDEFRLYSIGFNLQKIKNSDEYGIFIANIQGPEPSVPDMHNMTKVLTKASFGVQPRYLVIDVLFNIAKALKINHVYAIRTEAHVFMSKKHKDNLGSKIMTNFDEIWSVYNSKNYDESFVEIFEEERKAMEDISSNKRSMYRKRYAWLDELKVLIEEAISKK